MNDTISDAELEAITLEALGETDHPESDSSQTEATEEVVEEAPALAKQPPKKASGVKTFIKQSELASDIAFSEFNIDEAMMSQAAMFSRYANVSAQASLQSDRLKTRLEYVEAVIHKEFHDQAVETKTKVTEAGITKMTKLDTRYQKAAKDYNEAKMVAAAAKSTVEAFTHRRDMLVQIGKGQREDRLGDLRIKERADRIQSLRESAMSKVGANS